MRRLFTLWRREVEAYLYSSMAYFVMAYFLLIMGASFGWVLRMLSKGASGTDVIQELFGSGFFWLAVLMVVPIITMRLFAEERKAGTIETLMTAPVRSRDLVLSKFLGAFTFYVLLWLPTLAYVFIIEHLAEGKIAVDLGAMACAYFGTFVIGAAFIAVGVFLSSFAENQIVAAISTYAVLLLFFFCSFLPWITESPFLKQAFRRVSGVIHMEDFSRGALQSQPIVLYLSVTLLLLYLTSRLLETRDWR